MPLFAKIVISDPVPSRFGDRYTGLGFANYGLAVWLYNGYKGPVHWINFRETIIQADYDGATALRVWMHPGLNYSVEPAFELSISNTIPDLIVNGIRINPIKGIGVPPKLN